MAKREYLVRLTGDDRDLVQKVEHANGEIRKLNDNEIVLSIDFEKNDVGKIKDLVQSIANADPTLNIQLTYDMNLKSLEAAKDKAKKYLEIDDIIKKSDYDKASKYVLDEVNDINEQRSKNVSLKALTPRFKNLQDFVDLIGIDNLSSEVQDLFLKLADITTFSKAPHGDFAQTLSADMQEANNQVTILEGNLRRLQIAGAVDHSDEPIKGIGEFVRSFERLIDLSVNLKNMEIKPIGKDATMDERIAQLQKWSDEFDRAGNEIKELQKIKLEGNLTPDLEDRLGLLQKYQLETYKAFHGSLDLVKDNDDLFDRFLDANINDTRLKKGLEEPVKQYQQLIGHALDKARLKDGTFGVLGNVLEHLSTQIPDLYETELADVMKRIQEGAEAAGSAAEESAEKMKKDSDATRENTEEHEKNREEKEKAEEQSSESSKDQGSGGTGTGSDEADEGTEKASKLAEAFEKVRTILDSIDASLKDVSMSLGSVDADAGLTNLISSLKTINDLITQISGKDSNPIFNEADTLPDLSKIGTVLENISNIMTNLDASGFERMQAIAQELTTSLQEIVDANQKVSSSAEETSSELSKESSSMDDVSSSGTKTASAKEDVKGANEKLGASADESSAKLDTEAKSLDGINKQRAEEEKLAANMAKAYEDTRRKNYKAQQDIQDYLKRSGEQAYSSRTDDRFRDRYIKQNFPDLASLLENPELDNPDYADTIKKQSDAAKREIQAAEKVFEELNKEMAKFTNGGDSGKAAMLMPDEFIKAQLEYQNVMDNPNIFGMTKFLDNMKQQNAELEVLVNGQDVLWKKYQQTLAEVQQPGGLIDQHTAMFGNRAKDNQSLWDFTRANAAVDKNNADSMISVLNVVAKMKQEMSEADIAADKMATTMQRAYSLGNDISQKGMSDVLGNEISSIKQDLMAFDGSAEELEKFTTRLDDVDAKFKQVTENSDRYSQLLKDAFDVRNFVQGDTDLTRIFGDDNVGIIGALNDMFSSPEEAFTANGKQYLDDLETFVSTVKNSVHEAATGMDSDIDAFTNAMGTLYSGKNDYLKNLRMQATSKDGFDSIGKQIADYEAGIKSVSTLIDSMKAKWGENSDIVSNATKAFAKYQQDTTANMAQDIAKQAQQQIDKIDRAMKTRGEQGSGFMAEYAQRLDEAKTNAQDIVDALAHGTPPPDSSEWKTWLSTLESGKNTLKEINDQSNLLATQNQLSKLLTKVNQDIEKGAQYGQLGDSYAKLKSDVEGALSSLKSANDAGEALSKIEFRNFADAYQQLHATGVEIGAFKGTFLSKFSDAITNQSAQFLATYFSFQDMIRYGKEVVNTVVQTDSALTELKKVSDASNERIQQSFQTSAETAQELGSTITDVVNSTSDWARMGYSIDEAEKLSRVTTLFQTVGDNMTQETASQALVSTLKGFQMDADQAIDIVDKFNEVECCLAA